MIELNLPSFDVKVKKTEDSVYIWDKLRRKYIVLTPEEWVRQHFINYLTTEKGYPEALIANEQQIILNNCKRRCDSIVYDNKLRPVVIVEYKAPDVKITQEVFNQIARYNIVLRVGFLIVSNGIEHYCCRVDYENQSINYLKEIPPYVEVTKQ